MKRVLLLLVIGTILSGVAAVAATARTDAPDIAGLTALPTRAE